MEKMEGGSVDQQLKEFGYFEEQLAVRVVRDVLTGLAHLHSLRLVHRDVKGSNVLGDGNLGYKLTDLGTVKKQEDVKTLIENSESSGSIKGSIYWMAPEVLLEGRFSRRSDIWSVGCLAVEMLRGRHPWPNFAFVSDFIRHFQAHRRPELPEGISLQARGFLDMCLQWDRADRATAQQLLEHAWLA